MAPVIFFSDKGIVLIEKQDNNLFPVFQCEFE